MSSDAASRLTALRRYRHPVAHAADVAERAHAATLLDEPLVLWRFDAVAYRRAMRAQGLA